MSCSLEINQKCNNLSSGTAKVARTKWHPRSSGPAALWSRGCCTDRYRPRPKFQVCRLLAWRAGRAGAHYHCDNVQRSFHLESTWTLSNSWQKCMEAFLQGPAFFPKRRIHYQSSAVAVQLRLWIWMLLWACCSSRCHSSCSLFLGAAAGVPTSPRQFWFQVSLITPEQRNCLFCCRTGILIPVLITCA